MAITTIPIDCMATARRILSSPEAVYSATPFEIVAMAACTVRESTGEMPALPTIADPPVLPASLAASLAIAILAWNAVEAATDGDSEHAWLAFDQAFNGLRTQFEKEFPNGSDAL